MASWIGRLFTQSKGVGQENGNGDGHGRAEVQVTRLTPNGNAASLSPLVDPDDVLAFEFGRARRYERALSIVVVSPLSWPDDHGSAPTPIVHLLTAAGLREILRETDIMCHQPLDGSFVLGLTESQGPSARVALERVQALFKSRLRIDLAVGVAQFPNDGLTLDDLIAVARAQAGATKVLGVLSAPAPEAHAAPSRRQQSTRGRVPGLSSRAVGSE